MIKIYVSYFNESHIVRNKVLTPIQAGRALANKAFDMIGDDEGENISEKNHFYCELTSQYWAWKNDTESEYLGFMHYRRFLDFYSEKPRANDSIHGIIEEKFSEDFVEKFGLTEENIVNLVKDYDIIVRDPFDFNHIGSPSIEHQYKHTADHFAKDFDTARSIVAEMSPESLPYFNKMAASPLFYATNIFIMKRRFFEEYCAWLFPILEKIDLCIDSSSYTTQQKRVVGYLAERLFNVYLIRKIDTDPNLKIKTLRPVFIKDTKQLILPPPLPDTKLPVVCVCATTDQTYLPHVAALIVSVLDNASHDKFIDFIVLDGGISENERQALAKLARLHPACSIRFIDMSKHFLDIKVRSIFSRYTFFRLTLPSILKNRDKAVFLDSDMIAIGDVTELFNTNLEGNILGAVKDLVMRALCSMGTQTYNESNMTAHRYLSDFLGLKDKVSDYFQAGTLVFDLKKMREELIEEKVLSDLKSKSFWLVDQDILNKHLVGKVKFLNHSWNTVLTSELYEKNLTKSEKILYLQAQKSPNIIHYAGIDKPWNNMKHPFAHYYWFYLRKTPWYEKVFMNFLIKNQKQLKKRKKFKDRIKQLLRIN